MYENYWQLEAKPFESVDDERFHYAAPSHQAAMHKLRYTIEGRRSAAMLAGPSGTGKSHLVHLLRHQLDPSSYQFVELVFPMMSSRDLLVYLAEELAAPPVEQPQHSVEESLRRVKFELGDRVRQGKHTVLVVDEAHLLEDSGLLETFRLLLNLQVEGKTAFTLILLGQASLVSALERYRALEERLDMKVVLKPFSEEETIRYVEHRLEAAGASRSIFATDALGAIQQLTGGVARRINRLCDLALVVGYAGGEHTIDAEQLHSVHEELVAIKKAA